jgi:hypothetical protein
MTQDSFEAYLKSLGPYIGDPKCFSYSYDDLQEAFKAGYNEGYNRGDYLEGWEEGYSAVNGERLGVGD